MYGKVAASSLMNDAIIRKFTMKFKNAFDEQFSFINQETNYFLRSDNISPSNANFDSLISDQNIVLLLRALFYPAILLVISTRSWKRSLIA